MPANRARREGGTRRRSAGFHRGANGTCCLAEDTQLPRTAADKSLSPLRQPALPHAAPSARTRTGHLFACSAFCSARFPSARAPAVPSALSSAPDAAAPRRFQPISFSSFPFCPCHHVLSTCICCSPTHRFAARPPFLVSMHYGTRQLQDFLGLALSHADAPD